MGTAGGSARAEYERRRARDRARIRGNLGQRVTLLAATPIFVFLAVRFGVPWALDSFFEGIASRTTSGDAAAMSSVQDDPSLWTLAGVVVATGATASVGRQLFGRRSTTEAWRRGADGEVLTARVLDGLPALRDEAWLAGSY